MDPADEMAAKIEAALRQSTVAVAGSDAVLRKFDERFRALKDLQPASSQSSNRRMPADDSPSLAWGIDHQLDDERWALRAIYNRLLEMEKETKKRGSRGFASYLVAVCIGVAAALAWQSYDLAALRQVSAAQDHMADEISRLQGADIELLASIPSPPAHPPAVSSIDPEQVHQMTLDLAALRQSVEQVSAGQDQMAGEITKLQGADTEILAKIPSPPAQAARARKPAPTAPRSSRTVIPSHL